MIENPRFKLLIARYGRRMAVGLLIAGALLLLVAGWIALTPPTTTASDQTDRQTVATTADTRAVVTGGDLWEPGTELRNNPAYLTNATPTVDVVPRTSVPEGSSARVTHEVRLRIAAERDGNVFWESSEVLVRDEQVVDNGTAVSTATVDVREHRERIAQLRERLAGVGSVRTEIVVTADYDTGRYAGRLSSSSRLVVTDRAYWLEDELSDSQPHFATTTRQVTQSPNWFAVALTALLGLLALTAAWTVVATKPEELDVEALKQELHRRKYADWISTGSIPMWVGQNYVELDSLEGVVDVAIDTKERVVHDTRRDLFAVISDNVVYYYSKSGDWDQSSWPRMDLPGNDAEDTVDVGPENGSLGELPDSDELPGDGDADSPEDWDDDDWRNL